MGDERMLRARAREAMKAGKLPEHPPERTWGGPGSGAPCALCGKTVGNEEIEFELQFASDRDSGAATYHLHTQCFAVWELERRHESPNDDALPQGGNEGIMRGRERNATAEGE